MFKDAWLGGVRALVVVALVVAVVIVARAGDPGTPQRKGAAPPGTHGLRGKPPVLRPEQIEKQISRAEREVLGLARPSWVAPHGKVHPDVRAILETGEMPWLRFKGWHRTGFERTA